MNANDLKGLIGRIKIELPKLVRKPIEPKETRTRDLKSEVEVDSLTGELFAGLREQTSLLRKLMAVRDPGAEVKVQIDTLTSAIAETKQAIKSDLGLYSRWFSGPLAQEDELAVSLDLAERGVLAEISQEEASRNKEAWSQYRELRRMGKDGDDESTVQRPQTLFTVKEVTGSNSARQRYFVKRMIPKGEQFPDGYSRLMAAYAGHFQQKRAHYKEMGKMVGLMLSELGVEEGKTLKYVEAGEPAVVAVEVMSTHEWKGQDGRPLSGTVVFKCHGTEGGVAKVQILGAVGSIYHSLRRHIESEQLFAYKAGRAFEGMSKADTGEDQAWFRAFLAKVAGLNTGGRSRTSAPYAPQYIPQTPRGERGEDFQGKQPRKAKGRRAVEKGQRGGGRNRADASQHEKD
ncbi:MAG: hypothetical protein WAP51_05085 [Candidatus Sungiibacteriota bacterium]